MKKIPGILCFLLVFLGFVLSEDHANAQVNEIPNSNLPDIAMVTIDGYGNPVIIYNPILCQQAGPALCEFYRVHEYGHIVNGHTIVPKWPWQKEAEADCWAAQNASSAAVMAAYQWFSIGGGASPAHGTSWQRAARLSQCAGF